MASRKRSHDEMTPESRNSASLGSLPLDLDTHGTQEPVTKKFKCAESGSDPVIGLIDSTLASIVVEPCMRVGPLIDPSTSPFVPISGREAEFKLIEDHYAQCLETRQPQPLFVCGAPGCGKTASISKIMASSTEFSEKTWQSSVLAPYTARVNCAADLVGSKPSALYSLLYNRLVEAFDASPVAKALRVQLQGVRPQDASEQELLPFLLQRINQYHIDYSKQSENRKPYFILVLIDEIDHVLLSRNSLSAELHFLFSSWLESWGILSIVAISNTHDLFERNLPLLSQIAAASSSSSSSSSSKSAKSGVLTVPFKPYSRDQLEAILRSRVSDHFRQDRKADAQPATLETIFDAKTLKFVCGKIANLAGSQVGDVRILIDLSKAMLLEARSSKKLPITLDVAAKVWKLKMGSTPTDPVLQLSRTQKCALVCMIHASGASEAVRPADLEATWKMRTSRMFPSAADLSELWSAMALLEGTGHVRLQKEKGNRVIYKLSTKDQTRESLAKDPIFKDFLP